MLARFSILFCVAIVVCAQPTMYKMKGNKNLELDLVAVSSTVIPLPIYKVGHGINVVYKGNKHVKSDSPAALITAQNKKKYYYSDKSKKSE